MLRLVNGDELRLSASLRKAFLEYLEGVKDWAAVELSDDDLKSLVMGLRQVASQEQDYDQGNAAVALFSDFVKKRPADKARIVALLNELRQGDKGGIAGADSEGGARLVVAEDLEKDLFVLKFVLIGSRGLQTALQGGAVNNPSETDIQVPLQKPSMTSIQEHWNESVEEVESLLSKEHQSPQALTNLLRGITQRITKLEEEVKRHREEFDAVKLSEKEDSADNTGQARSSRDRQGKKSPIAVDETPQPKRPISMFTEDKRVTERPLTPVQENISHDGSVMEKANNAASLKPMIAEMITKQVADAVKGLQMHAQGQSHPDHTRLLEQIATLRDESVSNQKTTMESLQKVTDYVNSQTEYINEQIHAKDDQFEEFFKHLDQLRNHTIATAAQVAESNQRTG